MIFWTVGQVLSGSLATIIMVFPLLPQAARPIVWKI